MGNEIITIPEDFDFARYAGNHFGIFTGKEEYGVKIKFTAKQAPFIKERMWHDTQEIAEQDDGSLVLSFRTNYLFEVKKRVLSRGQERKRSRRQNLSE